VKIPLQAHFADKDDWCTPPAGGIAFEKAMKAAGKSLETFSAYGRRGTPSSTSSGQSVHDRKAAELAWDRAIGFFQEASWGEDEGVG